jgi:hypothetical protein
MLNYGGLSMATLAELQTQLAEVNTAISAVLTGGQEYRFNDGQIESMVKRGDLFQLRQLKKDIEFQIEEQTETGGFYGF